MTIGVYKIINTINNKAYVGSSSSSIEQRFKNHISKLKRNQHHSIKLQNAWNKYGESYFKFEIIEECIPEECVKREQYYLDLLEPFYNILKIAGSSIGRKASTQTRERISKALKGKIIPWNKGVSRYTLEEVREKRRIYARKYRDRTRLSKEEISKIHKDSSHKLSVVRSDGQIFESIREAARVLDCCHSEICRAIKRNLRVKGYFFALNK